MLRKIGLIVGPVAFVLTIALMDLFSDPKTACTLAVAFLMLVWWVTEAIPIAVTALLPVFLFPVLGICTPDEAAAPYAKDYVFLFLGGFIIALALEKHNLHRFIALSILTKTGTSPKRIILGIMISTAFLSMWISNTATAVMMLPIATTAAKFIERTGESDRNFTVAILLSVAYSASIGGIATLIGTPTNMVMAGILDSNYGTTISFTNWILIGLPFSLIMLLLTYFLLTGVLFRIPKLKSIELGELLRNEKEQQGPLTNVQKRVLYIFVGTCLLWVFKDLIHMWVIDKFLSDPVIAIGGGIAMFLVPEKRFGGNGLLEWTDSVKLPWGIILLFGGGLSLAAGLGRVGVMEKIGSRFENLQGDQVMLLVFFLTSVSLLMTEVMSNVALVSVFVPVVAGIGVNAGLPPETLAIPVTLAASCAFMLPMATPPNAIVFSTGDLTIMKMAKTGLLLNLVSVIVIWTMWRFGLFSLVRL